MTAKEKSIGQVCHDAYVSEFKGSKFERPPWEKLHTTQRRRWERAALAVHGLEVVAVVRQRSE